VRHTICLGLLVLASAPRATAQGLPFKVVVVDWETSVRSRQQSAYRGLFGDREVLYCVESWRTVAASEGVERLVIERVRAERGGGANGITDVGSACLDDKGASLPMFHTHSDGNCQFSPADLVTIVARGAPFEGIQCGRQHFVWEFAWQVLAIANSVERGALTGRRYPELSEARPSQRPVGRQEVGRTMQRE
jgi:hypothetical protein